MQKQRTVYDSPLDAILALTRRLSIYEERYQLKSENFFDQFSKGLLDDRIDFIEWSNDYQNFLALKFDLEERLSHAA